MTETDGGDTPSREAPSEASTNEASGEQQGRGTAPVHLDDPPAISGFGRDAPEDQRTQKPPPPVPGRRPSSTPPVDRAGDIPQQGSPQDEDPRSASGLTASEIAVVGFTACQVYKEAVGQTPRVWHQLDPLDRKEIVGQVVAAMTGQNTHPARNHDTWVKNMLARGITAEDDPRVGMIWSDLPEQERRKAYLFEAITRALLTRLA